ncbi:MAG: biotin--[acetyl-CoA-carboxylase] ligase [Peptoniphilus sp.]|nr:biotin--[acetyl-CoA-carboxylase] ligase [Peptoniphilus sp.]MDD7362587.1 biotin--[acetyl-CoA-carboxylase] ligase [Bacillota bacterium]MDY6045014.1 biotin--[acetyl-CoA-carboxylase] ligase [Peptoniphilus sp.]
MKNKDYILQKLQSSEDYLSGENLAEELHITRASVWQSIRDLRKEGYRIEAVTNRGYRLVDDYEALDEKTIRPLLDEPLRDITILVEDTVDSTNDALFRYDEASTLSSFSFMVAEEQTAGKGRVGKSFLSPYGSGLYLSTLIRPSDSDVDPNMLTIAAAVAAREALARQTEKDIRIKWVNDLYIDHKKISGILTEADFSKDEPRFVIGIGINTSTPRDTFDKKELRTAGSVGEETLSRNRLAADLMNALYRRVLEDQKTLIEAYRRYNLTIGRVISFSKGDIEYKGIVTGIDDDGKLLVDVGDQTMTLAAGSISIQGNW